MIQSTPAFVESAGDVHRHLFFREFVTVKKRLQRLHMTLPQLLLTQLPQAEAVHVPVGGQQRLLRKQLPDLRVANGFVFKCPFDHDMEESLQGRTRDLN